MPPYRITLLTGDGSVHEVWTAEYRDDDHALEQVGRLIHPYKIQVHQGERLVGEFDALWRPSKLT
jgi:hypothetical protein